VVQGGAEACLGLALVGYLAAEERARVDRAQAGPAADLAEAYGNQADHPEEEVPGEVSVKEGDPARGAVVPGVEETRAVAAPQPQELEQAAEAELALALVVAEEQAAEVGLEVEVQVVKAEESAAGDSAVVREREARGVA